MSGVKHDQSKPRLTLVDPAFTEEMALILDQGEQRYGRANWKAGLTYSRLLDASRRHLAAIEQGEDTDPDSGHGHAAHVACSMMFLTYFKRNQRSDLDDRNYGQDGHEDLSGMRNGDHEGQHLPESPGAPGLRMQAVSEREGERSDPAASQSLEDLQRRVTSWADEVFPERTPHNALTKMVVEEIPELLNGDLDDPHEFADVLIMLIDAAHLLGIDIVQAGYEKHAINEGRTWTVDTETGLLNHIGDDE